VPTTAAPSCTEYFFENITSSTKNYSYTNCSGTFVSGSLTEAQGIVVCSQDGNYNVDAGIEVTNQGSCSYITPTTAAPTTDAPTTDAPTTDAPTTDAPTTDAPTTDAPTTDAPTTDAPTTNAPTTAAPSCTEYLFENTTSSTKSYSYTNCSGTFVSGSLTESEGIVVCAQDGSYSVDSGIEVTNQGSC
jgi:hypothetical protein